MLTHQQKEQIKTLGINENQINEQVNNFKKGFPYVELVKPATIGDGIFVASDNDIAEWTNIYNEFTSKYKVVKFVPASGAATRMFVALFEYLDNPSDNKDVDFIFENLEKFAFYKELSEIFKKEGKDITKANRQEIIKKILTEEGLNYSNSPKGLLLFHDYPDTPRTAVEEHIVEGLLYARSNKQLNLHFTISPEYEKAFQEEFRRLKNKYENKFKIKIKITHSFQKKSTDTVAVTPFNDLFINENGNLLLRPGGHGALLENLNDIDADLILIKNIDNVAHDYLKPLTVRYKKAIAGLLVKIKHQIDEYLVYLEKNNKYSDRLQHEIGLFIKKYLGETMPICLDNEQFSDYVKSKLNKPVRVCGMVKNAGEPGGGPFWVANKAGGSDLQIIESSQVDKNNNEQVNILNSATHFNPVDLACYIKDYKGYKFNLIDYRDPETGFISSKTVKGKQIKAQELSGLWNGSMAHWLTIFVEVPLQTFTPAKTISDLLRKEHQPQE